MQDLLVQWLLPALLALLPAAVRLWRGRLLLPHLDDPALPERLVATRGWPVVVFAAVLTLQGAVWPSQAFWTIPLLLLSLLAAGWPLRRALFGETWSLAAYLSFYLRLIVAIYGFWILLMAAPWLTMRDGEPAWWAAATLGAILLVWNEQHVAILRFILRTRPVTTPALVERFREITARTTVPAPNIEYVDMRGGVFVNAIALPETTRPTVAFTGTLLERLDDDEIAGIFAHELAHLEYFSAAYLRKFRYIGGLLITAAVLIAPLVQTFAPGAGPVVWFWPFAVIMYVAILTRQRQKHETDSDLRAVALTGDPEALIRGLIKLHELAKLPRRLDPNAEVNASHPSLARRIQSIRAASGTAALPLEQAVTLQHGTTSVTLHADRLEWTEGDVTSYTLAYAALDELRVEATGTGGMRLSVSDPQGRTWTLPLAQADVARAQAALDVVDARLRPKPAGANMWAGIGRLVGAWCALGALGSGQLSVALVIVLAMMSFERPLIFASAAAGLVGTLLAWRGGDWNSVMSPALALSAVLLLFIAIRTRRDPMKRATWLLVAVIGGLALFWLAPIALARGDLRATHEAARNWPATAVFAIAFAAAIWMRRRWWLAAAAAAAALGSAAIIAGSTRTLDAWLDDPFLAPAPAATTIALPAEPSAEVAIAFVPERVLLAPDAAAMAAEATDYTNEETTYHVGRPGAALTAIPAVAALFVDGNRMLVAADDRSRTRLRLIDVDRPSSPVWETTLDLTAPRLAIDRAGSSWQALGKGSRGEFVRAQGPLAGGAAVHTQWPAGSAGGRDVSIPLAAAADRLLVAVTEYQVPNDVERAIPWPYLFASWRSSTRVAMLDRGGASALFRTTLNAQCYPATTVEDGAVCSAFDGSRTHFAAVTVDGAVRSIGKMQHAVSFDVDGGWITGWGESPFAMNASNGELLAIPYDRAATDGRPLLVAAADRAIAVAVARADDAGLSSAILRIYRRSAMR